MKHRITIILGSLIVILVGLAGIFCFFLVIRQPFVLTNKDAVPIVVDNSLSGNFFGKGVTILLTRDHRVFYYKGSTSDDQSPPVDSKGNATKGAPENKIELNEISWSGDRGLQDFLNENNFKIPSAERRKNPLRDTIYEKEVAVVKQQDAGFDIFIIKTDSNAKYADVVKLIDGLKLQKVSKFVLQDLHPKEKEALQKALAVKP